MRLYGAVLAVLAASMAAQASAQTDDDRRVTVTVYGNDPCPDVRAGDEIVVCARRPETERYRIPKELRGRGERPSETAWGSRVAGLEDASRPSMPGSCSPVGTYGQSGCRQQSLRDWYAERRAARRQKDSD